MASLFVESKVRVPIDYKDQPQRAQRRHEDHKGWILYRHPT